MNTLQPNDVILRKIHKETAYMPLTAHRMLSDDGQEQESVFGDTITVQANFAKATYRVKGLKGEKEIFGQIENGRM